MQIDDFLTLARRRRSIRKFTPDPVPDESVEQILEAARWAMSGGNSQPWQFIVIRNRDVKESLADIYCRYRDISLTTELTRLEEFRQPAFRAATGDETIETLKSRYTLWCDAPVVIAILGDCRMMQASTLAARLYEMHTLDHNLACAAYAVHLAAAALGLGAQWLTLLPPMAEAMKEILKVPHELSIFNLNPIGYPAVQPVPYRRELEVLVHSDRYDMKKFMSNADVQEYIKYQRTQHARGSAYKVGEGEK